MVVSATETVLIHVGKLRLNPRRVIALFVINSTHRVSKLCHDTVFAGVTTITSLVISRTGRDSFTALFNQLAAQVKAMTLPVTLARTGVICA